MTPVPPAGYVQVAVGRCTAVVMERHADDARALLAHGTVYDAAATTTGARRFHGRGPAFGIALPVSGDRVVVRRNRHGGLLAPLTGDRFLPPGRAPHELRVSLALRALGIATPEMVLHAAAPALLGLVRADVATREIADGRDLAEYLAPAASARERAAAWRAAHVLLAALAEAGARHHDLNAKNVLLAPASDADGTLRGWILDVDRIELDIAPDGARRANAARLARSVRKWVRERGATATDPELAALDELTR